MDFVKDIMPRADVDLIPKKKYNSGAGMAGLGAFSPGAPAIRILAAVLGAVYILGIWGVHAGPMLAGLGIAGLALALALQLLPGNFFQPDKSVRVSVEFAVEYGTDPEYVKRIVIEEINSIDFLDKSQEARVLFTEMGDSSLNFRALFWVDDISKKWPANQEGMSRIYRRLYDEKIGIPFPQSTVWLTERAGGAGAVSER